MPLPREIRTSVTRVVHVNEEAGKVPVVYWNELDIDTIELHQVPPAEAVWTGSKYLLRDRGDWSPPTNEPCLIIHVDDDDMTIHVTKQPGHKWMVSAHDRGMLESAAKSRRNCYKGCSGHCK